jgi:hypothetical protein
MSIDYEDGQKHARQEYEAEIANLKAEIKAMRESAIEVAKLLDPGIQAEMALHVEIANLRAEAEQLRFDLKMWMDRWDCSPYESIVQHDILVARINTLENALRDANIGHADGCRCVGCILVFAPQTQGESLGRYSCPNCRKEYPSAYAAECCPCFGENK